MHLFFLKKNNKKKINIFTQRQLLETNLYSDPTNGNVRGNAAEKLKMRLVASVLYFAHVGLHFTIMLLAMTFNLWVFLVIIIGSGLGYFIFRSSGELFDNDKIVSSAHC
jgi:hypothetical protein